MRRQTLCMLWVLVLVGSARAEQVSLIADPTFARGFAVLDPTPGALVVQGNLQWDASAGPPIWQLGQWDSQSTIYGVAPTLQPSGARAYVNADKQIIAGGGPAAVESDLILTINGQSEYGGTFRGIGDPWPALLVQQSISEPGGHLAGRAPSIADMASLDFQIDACLLYDDHITTGEYDPSIHASQYVIFYTVQNLNTASAGYGDFLWFGTALYDDRFDVTGEVVLVDGFTQKLIYGIGIEPFTSEKIADGNWMTIGGDLLPYIKTGLQEAWSRGLLLDSLDFADYKIGGMNMGWEMPGMNDASMQIRNYSVIATLAESSGLLGDLNGDGFVNSEDLDAVRANWGTPGPAGDANDDGTVNSDDLDIVRANWGPHATVAVPEPAAFALLAAFGLLAFLRRRCYWSGGARRGEPKALLLCLPDNVYFLGL